MAKGIRFMKYYVTDGVNKVKCYYSENNRMDGRDCVTIWAEGYGPKLAALGFSGVKNDTDLMTDYFEKDHVDILADNPLYPAALARCRQNKADQNRRWEARMAKIEARQQAIRQSSANVEAR